MEGGVERGCGEEWRGGRIEMEQWKGEEREERWVGKEDRKWMKSLINPLAILLP